MLSQAWIRNCRLPSDPASLCLIVRCTRQQWAKYWPKVSRYWRKEGDELVNDTQLEVYAEAQAMRERASERGKSGAQARLKQRLSTTQATPEQHSSDAQASLEHKPPSPSTSQIEEHPQKAGGVLPARATHTNGAGGPNFQRNHLHCEAPCGRVCLPELLFETIVRLRGGSRDDAEDYVRRWKRRVDDEWGESGPHASQPIGDDAFAFWRARWREDHPTTATRSESMFAPGTSTEEILAVAQRQMAEEKARGRR